jgi:glycogen(starch) synthase
MRIVSSQLASQSHILVTGDPFFLSRHRLLIDEFTEHWPSTRELGVREQGVLRRIGFGVQSALAGRCWPPTRATLHSLRNEYLKKATTFERLSAQTEQTIAQLEPQPDFVFQFFGMSSPAVSPPTYRYSHYMDVTMAFVRRVWPAWAPFRKERDYEAWIACEGESYRGAHRIFTFTEATRRSVINDYGVDPARVVAVGAAGNYRTTSMASREYGTRSLVFNGSDFYRKGGDLVIAAFPRIRAAVPDATLAIIGDDTPVAMPGVSVLGSLTHDKLVDRLDQADIAFAPSRFDTFPGFTLEAMSRGLVPVVADCPAMSEMIADGVEGYVVSDARPEVLAEKVIELLKNPARLRTFGLAARSRIEQDWNWPTIARRIVASLED